MDKNAALNRAYGQCPKDVPHALKPIETIDTGMAAWLARTDWTMFIAGFAFAIALVAASN